MEEDLFFKLSCTFKTNPCSYKPIDSCSPKQGIYFNLLRRTRNNVGHIAKISDILHKSS